MRLTFVAIKKWMNEWTWTTYFSDFVYNIDKFGILWDHLAVTFDIFKPNSVVNLGDDRECNIFIFFAEQFIDFFSDYVARRSVIFTIAWHLRFAATSFRSGNSFICSFGHVIADRSVYCWLWAWSKCIYRHGELLRAMSWTIRQTVICFTFYVKCVLRWSESVLSVLGNDARGVKITGPAKRLWVILQFSVVNS